MQLMTGGKQWLGVSVIALFSGGASAGMGNLGTTYGVLPSDIATAQALSQFNSQASVLYYNPAYMVKDSRGELTVGLLHAQPELTLNSQGGADPDVRSGSDVLENTPSQQLLLGMKTDLTKLTRYEKPTYFGVMLGIEKYNQEMMAFSSKTGTRGQYLEYGRQPLFLILGGGINVWRGIDLGLSVRVTLQSTATLKASTDFGGNTSNEAMEVSAKPVMRPIVGATVDWGKTLCPDHDCWLDGLETAFTFKGYSNTKTTVASQINIPQGSGEQNLPLSVATLDSYQPNIYTLGVAYGKANRYRAGVSLEMQEWSGLNDELKKDSIKDQAVTAPAGQGKLAFRDIVVPRIGGEYWLNDHYIVSAGVAYSQTPLKTNASLDVNYLDADKLIAGVGLKMIFDKPVILAFPLQVDVGYQRQQLQGKTFDLYSTNKPDATVPFETVKAKGAVDVFSASVTMKF